MKSKEAAMIFAVLCIVLALYDAYIKYLMDA